MERKDVVLNYIVSQKYRELVLMLFIVALCANTSCKKEITPVEPPTTPPAERTTNQLVMDSIYFYFKEQSYWTSSVQNADPISTFTDQFFVSSADLMTNANSVLNALTRQTPAYEAYRNINGGFLDRFSFVAEASLSSNSARADKSDGYGIFETLARVNNSAVGHIYISFVEGGSPAALAGIQRGDRIVAINDDRNLEVPLSADGVPQNQNAINLVARALESTSFTIEVDRAGVVHKHDLQYATYDIDPLITDTVFTIEGQKIGYFALSSFEQTSGTAGLALRAKLSAMFNRFNTENVQDIIVDFRYNVGGYVHAAEFLANYLINNEGNRQLMYQSDTNPALRQGRYAGEFDDVHFVKSTTLNPRKLYFLIGNNTASASELVISALMAHYNPAGNDAGSRRLEIIGSPLAVKTNIGHSIPSTYGKPMGFFPQTIMSRVDLWAASFKIINANGYTDYWDGIPATYPTPVQDNILYNFGDIRESMTATALFHSLNNRFPAAQSTQARGANSATRSSSGVEIIQEINPRAPRELKKFKQD